MAQKFQKVIPKVPWPREVTEAKIKSVWDEIGEFNRMVNQIDRTMSGLLEQKMIIKIKIGNKTKYANQLKAQLEEPNVLNSDQNAQASVATDDDSSNADGTQK